MRYLTSTRVPRLLTTLATVAVSALCAAAQSITLAWDASPDANVAGYKLYCRAQAGAYTNGNNVGKTTTVSVSNLIEGTTYVFAASAYNALGIESSLSPEVSYTALVAPVANPPVVATMSASSVTAVSAMLNGLVNPNGAATITWFDYGPSTNYGLKTPETAAGSGSMAVGTSRGISGLLPGTIYHFRIAATNAVGAAFGLDQGFVTGAMAPLVATQPASSITWKSATLNASVNPNGAAAAVWFEYGLSTNYGNITSLVNLGSTPKIVSASSPIGALLAGTIYHFHAIATNAAGIAKGPDQTFTTALHRIAKK